jgi:adenylate kinase
MNLIFLGPHGAGKGTQAQLLQQREGIPQISTGDMLRAAIAAGGPLGRQARAYVDRGELVPDDVMIGIIEERLRRPDVRRGFVLDGFPRTLAQARALERIVSAEGRRIDLVIYFDVSEDVIVRRLTGRRLCRLASHIYHVEFSPPKVAGRCDIDGSELYQRDDDREDTIRHRLGVYRRETQPVVEFYRSHGLIETVGEADVETVYQRLVTLIKTRAGSS